MRVCKFKCVRTTKLRSSIQFFIQTHYARTAHTKKSWVRTNSNKQNLQRTQCVFKRETRTMVVGWLADSIQRMKNQRSYKAARTKHSPRSFILSCCFVQAIGFAKIGRLNGTKCCSYNNNNEKVLVKLLSLTVWSGWLTNWLEIGGVRQAFPSPSASTAAATAAHLSQSWFSALASTWTLLVFFCPFALLARLVGVVLSRFLHAFFSVFIL